MSRFTPSRLVLAAALVLPVAGCGSSASTTTAAASSAAPVPSSAAPGSIDMCSLLSADQLGSLTGELIGPGEEQDTPNVHTYKCFYNANSRIYLEVMRPSNATLFKLYATTYVDPQIVSGLGDQAVYDKTQGLMVLYGDTIVEATYQPGPRDTADPLDMDKRLVDALHSALA